jgi:hypothetical protein
MATPIPSDVLEQSAALIASPSFEGSVPYMYLDSAGAGNVTTAAGLLLPNLDAALALPWYTADFAREARQQEIASEFSRVKAMKPAMPASYYQRKATSPLLRDVDITHITATELGGMAKELEQHLPAVGSWPVPAILAALDMIWNLGGAKLFNEFPLWRNSAQAGNYFGMSLQCHRNGISDARNAWARDQFSKAHSMVMVTA